MYKLTALLISVLLLGFSAVQAQDYRPIVKPNIVVSGDEIGQPSQNTEPYKFGDISFNNVYSKGGFTWTVNNISLLSGRAGSGYDLQSNGSTQEIWYDLTQPGFVHAVFAWSAVDDNAWADRTCLYFGSTDGGVAWFELGAVPVNNLTTGRSGFPSIVGTSTGAAVISNHNNAAPHPTRATVFIDNSAFEYNFTEYDPGAAPFGQGQAIWPILTINDNDDIVLAASINGGDSFYVNTLSSGVFSGWQTLDGDQAETYALATSPAGKVALVYIGAHVGVDDRDILYRESTDGGLSWSAPLTIFDCDETQFPNLVPGGLRGVGVTFYGEEPCATFEIGEVNSTNYATNGASEIYFWSPTINGGVRKVIADSSNVPWYQYKGINDVVWPLSRPVIGRSQLHDYLFVAFQATSGEYWPGSTEADSTSFFKGMFMYSSDGGDTWSDPEDFTPSTTPPLDFRHPSIVPVSPVSPADDDIITVHLAIQGDPMPGTTVNGWGIMPPSITAEYYHITTDILVVVPGTEDDIIANSFNLEQNYPNPFNPSTTINYTLAERSAVSLKVYDVLGNEVANLVNTTQEAGKHNVTFDASKLSSGLYIYTLNAGSYTSSRKMMLLK